jgi:membrane dipeptidase
MAINRRQFLQYSASIGASLSIGNLFSCAHTKGAIEKDKTILSGIRIIDAHAHPNQFFAENIRQPDNSSTIGQMRAFGMEASVFSAVGDLKFRRPDLSSVDTMSQLRRAKQLIWGRAKLVLKSADVPTYLKPGDPPGAILGIEGGNELHGNLNKVDKFYRAGVRVITLIHYGINEIGDNMSLSPKHMGLTDFGRKVVERMQSLGMVVDVAHAHRLTIKEISKISSTPLIDSHTDAGLVSRSRAWQDMELIAKTGGVICTWPLRGFGRDTFNDWAKEIRLMKNRLGIEHVSLGTDGGGTLPKRISGYRDIRNLVDLAISMKDFGLTQDLHKMISQLIWEETSIEFSNIVSVNGQNSFIWNLYYLL